MSVDQRSNSCNGSKSGRVVHVVRIRSVRITELSVDLVGRIKRGERVDSGGQYRRHTGESWTEKKEWSR